MASLRCSLNDIVSGEIKNGCDRSRAAKKRAHLRDDVLGEELVSESGFANVAGALLPGAAFGVFNQVGAFPLRGHGDTLATEAFPISDEGGKHWPLPAVDAWPGSSIPAASFPQKIRRWNKSGCPHLPHKSCDF